MIAELIGFGHVIAFGARENLLLLEWIVHDMLPINLNVIHWIIVWNGYHRIYYNVQLPEMIARCF